MTLKVEDAGTGLACPALSLGVYNLHLGLVLTIAHLTF